MQQYLLKKQKRKSLFARSPAIPVAMLFGGSVLFYFSLPLFPCLSCKRQQWQCLRIRYEESAQRPGWERSVRLPSSLSCLDSDEGKWAQREPSVFPPSFSPGTKAAYSIIPYYMCMHPKVHKHILIGMHICAYITHTHQNILLYFLCVLNTHSDIHTHILVRLLSSETEVLITLKKEEERIHNLEQKKSPHF